MPTRPDLGDLYRLADQVERDRDLSMETLRRRDHAIAAQIDAREANDAGDAGRLLYWLDRVGPAGDGLNRGESLAARLTGLLLLALGFAAMAGFLLGSGRGLVNVLLLLLVFVLLQFVMSLFSLVGLVRVVGGHAPASLPASPAHWVARRSLPDVRYLRESAGVLRLLYLRYGQEWGALFTLGALVAFIVIPALSDFSFVWGSTFRLGEGFMQRLCDGLAAPWSAALPRATVAAEVIANSRYHPALSHIDRAGIESMRGWWAFLFMCLLVYALLPRVLLWLAARYFHPRLLRASFTGYPGADLVLQRMASPLVRTQGADQSGDDSPPLVNAAQEARLEPDGRLLLLNWNDALAGEPPAAFEELQRVDAGNVVGLGRGGFEQDRGWLQAVDPADYDRLLVVVKSWEPPVAELADLLGELAAVPHCAVCLMPLPGKAVPHRRVEDWRGFTRTLPFAGVDVRLLNRVAAA